MPTELVKRVNLDLLYQPFLEKVLDGLSACRALGHDYYATLGFRTFPEQDALFAQGRTAPGAKVTAARGGESAHNYGLALDFCHDLDLGKAGLQMDWAGPHYDCLGEVMQARGLVWGGSWNTPDRPHVQWPGYVTAKELAPLLPLMKDASTPDVQKRLQNAWAVVK